jgi:hypothetical protein
MVTRYIDDDYDEDYDDYDEVVQRAVKHSQKAERENNPRGFSSRLERWTGGRDEVYLYNKNQERVSFREADKLLTPKEIKILRQKARSKVLVERKKPNNSQSIITKARYATNSKLVTQKR